jgi:hypothetical protein
MTMAFVGFYGSVRLDLPLGPTDVTLGCCMIFLAFGLSRVVNKTRSALLVLFCAVFALVGGCIAKNSAIPMPDAKAVHAEPLWLARVRNRTALPLLLPATNPLGSLAEMAGKLAPEYRGNVMNVLRDNLKNELTQRGFSVALPEDRDGRFPALAADSNAALRIAREAKLSGVILISEIGRWEPDVQKFVRVLVDFKLIRLADGAVLWERRVQGAIPTPSATNAGQASQDAVKTILHDLFAA